MDKKCLQSEQLQEHNENQIKKAIYKFKDNSVIEFTYKTRQEYKKMRARFERQDKQQYVQHCQLQDQLNQKEDKFMLQYEKQKAKESQKQQRLYIKKRDLKLFDKMKNQQVDELVIDSKVQQNQEIQASKTKNAEKCKKYYDSQKQKMIQLVQENQILCKKINLLTNEEKWDKNSPYSPAYLGHQRRLMYEHFDVVMKKKLKAGCQFLKPLEYCKFCKNYNEQNDAYKQEEQQVLANKIIFKQDSESDNDEFDPPMIKILKEKNHTEELLQQKTEELNSEKKKFEDVNSKYLTLKQAYEAQENMIKQLKAKKYIQNNEILDLKSKQNYQKFQVSDGHKPSIMTLKNEQKPATQDSCTQTQVENKTDLSVVSGPKLTLCQKEVEAQILFGENKDQIQSSSLDENSNQGSSLITNNQNDTKREDQQASKNFQTTSKNNLEGFLWNLQVDPMIAQKEAERLLNNSNQTQIQAVAADEQYDQLTRNRLNRILQQSQSSLKGKSFSNSIENEKILEAMSGWGRNVPVFKKFNPKNITIFDINQSSIDIAKQKFEEDDQVSAYQADINAWTICDYEQYRVIFGIWNLCYMSGFQIDKYLTFVKRHSKYLVLVEPVDDNLSTHREQYLNFDQQMINRHYLSYQNKFREFGFVPIFQETFIQTLKREDYEIQSTYVWILRTQRDRWDFEQKFVKKK